MKAYRILAFLSIIGSLSPLARGQQLDQLQEQWLAGNYRQVLPELTSYWKKQDGRTFAVEYMIGTSACRVDGYKENGIAMLKDLLHSFQLPEMVRTAAQKELAQCKQQTSNGDTQPSLNVVPVTLHVTPGAYVRGKEGYILPNQNSRPNSKITTSPISETELHGRLFHLSDGQNAIQAALKRLPSPDHSSGVIVGDFTVTAGRTESSFAQQTGTCLERYERPIEAEFQMLRPDYLITVYAVLFLEDLENYAMRLHGVQLPPGTVAYSVSEDLSMVGVGGPDNCGTLAHELVHLMIRRNFGNSPPWLEEGLASEVAISQPNPQTLEFQRSWRDDMLSAQWSQRPTVAQLLEMDWTDFTATSNDLSELNKVAAVHAMAACFIRYLGDSKQLTPVYFAVRDRHFSVDFGHGRTDREIVEDLLGKKLDAVDGDFVRWFQSAQPKSYTVDQPRQGATTKR